MAELRNIKRCIIHTKPHHTLINDREVHCSSRCITFKMDKKAQKYRIESNEEGNRHIDSITKWDQTRQVPIRESIRGDKLNEFPGCG